MSARPKRQATKTGSRGTAKRKRTASVRLSNRAKLCILACGLAMVTCVGTVVYQVLGHYDGLGPRQKQADNPYDPSAFVLRDGRFSYEDDTYRSVCGIDVSYYQEEIDWEKVKADGIDFAMIRLGYRGAESGEIHLDDRFEENLEGARKAGLEVGVYFFSQAVTPEEAIEEARYVVRHIRGEGVTYPVAFDMEPVNGKKDRIAGLKRTERTEIADAFCKVIRRNGYTPMVYGNPNWLNRRLDGRYLTEYQIWLAHYTEGDVSSYGHPFSMWQYTDHGRVQGIRVHVDLDICLIEQ